MTTRHRRNSRGRHRQNSSGADTGRPGPESAPTVGEVCRAHALAITVASAGYVALCAPTFAGLARFWTSSPDFSHGYAIPAVSAFLLFRMRKRLLAAPVRNGPMGAVVLLLAVAIVLGGQLTGIRTVARLAAWATMAAAVLFAFGPGVLRVASFPGCFLLLAIPPPFFVLEPLRAELRALVTATATELLHTAGLAPASQGNVIVVGDRLLEVADACSGIRSLAVIVATALLLSYITSAGWWRGALLVATSVPIAVAVNVARVVLIAVALTKIDVDLTVGAAHELTGLAMFAASLPVLVAFGAFYRWLLPGRQGETREAAP